MCICVYCFNQTGHVLYLFFSSFFFFFGRTCTSTSHQPRSFFDSQKKKNLDYSSSKNKSSKTIWIKPMWKKIKPIKWIKPSTGATDQTDLPTADQPMIHLLETQKTHQLRRSKQWNQNHMNQTHVNKNQTHVKKKKNQTHQTEPINPSTKQMQIKPIKTTRNQSTHPPPPWEPNLCRRQTGLSSLAFRRRRTDVGLPCGFLW